MTSPSSPSWSLHQQTESRCLPYPSTPVPATLNMFNSAFKPCPDTHICPPGCKLACIGTEEKYTIVVHAFALRAALCHDSLPDDAE